MQPLTEDETWAVLRLTFWHLERRRFKSAERLARGLLALDIQNGWAWYYYGESRRQQGDAGEAEKGYGQAAQRLDRPEIWLRLAEVRIVAKDFAAAREALERARRADVEGVLDRRLRALAARAG